MILERAKKEADKMGDEFISTEHLLLALIGIKSPAREILIKLGVGYENVLKILSELRGRKRLTARIRKPNTKFWKSTL
jgi:ATP-dependent Clp protease ATP-binding subunit ClpB